MTRKLFTLNRPVVHAYHQQVSDVRQLDEPTGQSYLGGGYPSPHQPLSESHHLQEFLTPYQNQPSLDAYLTPYNYGLQYSDESADLYPKNDLGNDATGYDTEPACYGEVNYNKNPNRKSTTELPPYFQSFFNFMYFNEMQTECFDLLFLSDHNTVVSSPTGSGKTVLFELAILKAIMDSSSLSCKIVYVAPMKALCHERTEDWKKKFACLNLTCNLLTGDTDFSQMDAVRGSDIIVTTPEKWDSMTRKWRDYKALMVSLYFK